MSLAALLLDRLHAAGIEVSAVPGSLRLRCPMPLSPELHTLVAQHRIELKVILAVRAGASPAHCAPADPLEDHRAELGRLPSWSDPKAVPPPAAWCRCCNRFKRDGGRWWCERVQPSGWCCWMCHPPDHLAPDQIVERRT